MLSDGGRGMSATASYDAIIIGAGISGMYQLHRLRGLGLRARVFEAGAGVGGTWYWNRYPGRGSIPRAGPTATPSPRRSCASGSGASTSRPSRRRCATATSSPTSSISAATSSSTAGSRPRSTTRPPTEWEIESEDGRQARAQFLITAIGPLSTPTMPTIPGRRELPRRGVPHRHAGRTSRSSFAGKRVAVIGTGATAVQAITEIAKTVGHLTVFQRTPNWCAPLHNSTIDAATQARIKATYPEIFALCRDSFGCFIHQADPAQGARGEPGGARGILREALPRARLRHLDGQLPRRAGQRGGQRHHHRVHAPEDPRAGARTRSSPRS